MVWDRHSFPRYRFSIDDNSFFLRDIAQKNYRSLFDCFYLEMLRDLHAKYGVKFTVNIYYTTAEAASTFRSSPIATRASGGTAPTGSSWPSTPMPTNPPRPYQDAPPEKLMADLELVGGKSSVSPARKASPRPR